MYYHSYSVKNNNILGLWEEKKMFVCVSMVFCCCFEIICLCYYICGESGLTFFDLIKWWRQPHLEISGHLCVCLSTTKNSVVDAMNLLDQLLKRETTTTSKSIQKKIKNKTLISLDPLNLMAFNFFKFPPFQKGHWFECRRHEPKKSRELQDQ